MLRLVTFDLYETLCFGRPSRVERLADACRQLGITRTAEDFLRPNVAAEEHYTVENGRNPLYLRTVDEQEAFWGELTALILREAGLGTDADTIRRFRDLLKATAPRRVLFDDVEPTLAEMRRRGLATGIISNTPVDATILCEQLGLCARVDFIVSSCQVGCEKPCHEIFEAALRSAGVAPDEAVHIGDQPRSDALGAVGAGMHALLLDRYGLLEHEHEYQRIASLAEVPAWLDARL